LFRDVIEPICDSFSSVDADRYEVLFSGVIAEAIPDYPFPSLVDRYNRIRKVRLYTGLPKRVFVLSRVTLGADIAVTSVFLNAAKRRFPNSQICLIGPGKNLELFAADEDVVPVSAPYARSGLLRERLLASEALRSLVAGPDTLVLDPDSRLTQLGLIPICDDSQYLFFESRAYGENSGRSIGALASEWLEETLGVSNARAYLAPPLQPSHTAITVSLGVGENEEKRIGTEFELAAITRLASFGAQVLIDSGAGGEESERIHALVDCLGNPPNVHIHTGSFASFASQITQSKLYFGYDSAGQHVAAASGIPLVTVFAGFACERTFERWYPTGPGPTHVIKALQGQSHHVTEETLAALTWGVAEAGLS
jgi:hypothetical protein